MSDQKIAVYALDLGDEMKNCPLETLFPCVSPETVKRIRCFRQREDACRTLYGELLAKSVLLNCSGLHNKNISFDTDDYGKPFCNEMKEIHFNISHSGRWVACVVDTKPVGIDIERITEVETGLKNTCFSPQECRDLYSHAREAQKRYFFALWTAKESYIKMKGKGLSLPLTSFSIEIGVYGQPRLLTDGSSFPQAFFQQYNIDHDYCLTVCASCNTFPATVQLLTIKYITDWLLTDKSSLDLRLS